MYLTKDILIQLEASDENINLFEHLFPTGTELINFIKHDSISINFLYWMFDNFSTTQEEKEAYYERLSIKCDNRESIYKSKKITNSFMVAYSTNVEGSENIYRCEDIKNSQHIRNSSTVENSKDVANSEFVFDGQSIIASKNITTSDKIISSNYVVGSSNVMNASNITNSTHIYGYFGKMVSNIKTSHFVVDSHKLEHCMFCEGLNDKKYHLFNKEISPEEFTMIERQMIGILGTWGKYIDNNSNLLSSKPYSEVVSGIQTNIIYRFENIPDKFWRWVKTLPNYDPMILYAITYNPNISLTERE